MMNEILLSIIIPTKNRYDTLLVVLDSIVESIAESEYEVVIQDNSDDNKRILDYLENKNCSRLKYFYNQESMPISDNTELAFENSSGKYLLFIGDDDFVSPKIIDVVKNIDRRGIDILIYNPGYYWWNSIVFASPDFYSQPENLWLPKKTGFTFSKLNSSFELQKILDKGAMAYDMLPRLYHGIVSRKQLNKLKSKIGRYIVGSCPDMDLATSLALNTDEYYHLNFPVTIFGASKNSGGGWTALKSHFGSIENLPFLRPSIKDNWSDDIPRIWSERTIYPQTVTEVLSAYKVDKKVNLRPLYAAMLVYEPTLEPNLSRYIIKLCGRNLISYLLFFKEVCKKISGIQVTKIKRMLKLMPFNVIVNVKAKEVVFTLEKNTFLDDK